MNTHTQTHTNKITSLLLLCLGWNARACAFAFSHTDGLRTPRSTDLRSVMFVSLMLAWVPGMWAYHWTRIKTLNRAKPRFSKPAFPGAPISPSPSKLSAGSRFTYIHTHSRHEFPVVMFAYVQSSAFINLRTESGFKLSHRSWTQWWSWLQGPMQSW